MKTLLFTFTYFRTVINASNTFHVFTTNTHEKNEHVLGHHVSTVAQKMDRLRTSGFYCEIVAGTTKIHSGFSITAAIGLHECLGGAVNCSEIFKINW